MRKNENKTIPLVKKMITLFLSILILLIQVIFIYYVFFSEYGYKNKILYVSMEIIGILCVFLLYNKRINTNIKLSWTIIIFLIPFAGTLLYLIIQNSHNLPKRKERKIEAYLANRIPFNNNLEELKEIDPIGYKLANSIHSNTSLPIYQDLKTIFFDDIKDKHASLIKDLLEAKKYIFLEYFILSDGKVLNDIIEVLEKKGKEGIEIKFIYDDVGSKSALSYKTKKRIRLIPNLMLCAYQPLGINFNPLVNYRDHRKLVVIDGIIAYTGGDNLADEYTRDKVRFGYWRDNAIKVEGSAVQSFILLFSQMWFMSTKETLETKEYIGEYHNFGNNNYVMPFGDGPTYTNKPAYDLFNSMFSQASHYIYISTPYFIIDDNIINSLCLAAKAGVEVIILVPNKPDKKTTYMMTKLHFGEIISSGGKIYLYTPGFNHAKNVIIDDKYAFAGTINLDYRSMFLHYECGCLLMNDENIIKMREDFLRAVGLSNIYSLEQWKKRNIFEKLICFFLGIISPLF